MKVLIHISKIRKMSIKELHAMGFRPEQVNEILSYIREQANSDDSYVELELEEKEQDKEQEEKMK